MLSLLSLGSSMGKSDPDSEPSEAIIIDSQPTDGRPPLQPCPPQPSPAQRISCRQTFSVLRENKDFYVDKTKTIIEMVQSADFVYLSRPPRFGKSLLCSTIKSLFSGEEKLFNGLYAEKNWRACDEEAWKKYPVIHISLIGSVAHVEKQLECIARSYGIDLTPARSLDILMLDLIRLLYDEKECQVVIIIDDCDSMTSNLLNSRVQQEQDDAIEPQLFDFFSTIKASDAFIRFCFVTGCSSFSSTGFLSGMSSLKVTTMVPNFNEICGFTKEELSSTFKDQLKGLDHDRIDYWFAGYSWGGEARLYNPWGVAHLADSCEFLPYYQLELSFIMALIKKREQVILDIDRVEVSLFDLERKDLSSVSLEVGLFDVGFLTVDKIHQKDRAVLTFPNYAVESGFYKTILRCLHIKPPPSSRVKKMFSTGGDKLPVDVQDFLQMKFAEIPDDFYSKNDLSMRVCFYASVVLALCESMKVSTEIFRHMNQVDLTVEADDQVTILQIKLTPRKYARPNAAAKLGRILGHKLSHKVGRRLGSARWSDSPDQCKDKRTVHVDIVFDPAKKNVASVSAESFSLSSDESTHYRSKKARIDS